MKTKLQYIDENNFLNTYSNIHILSHLTNVKKMQHYVTIMDRADSSSSVLYSITSLQRHVAQHQKLNIHIQ